MRFRFRYLERIFFTLKDVGIKRLFLRFQYEILKFMDRVLPDYLTLSLTKGTNYIPHFLEGNLINEKIKISHNLENTRKNKKIIFKFLNKELEFSRPFNWDPEDYERLWLFNLHYFDWATRWLDNAIDNGFWEISFDDINYLIDNWIISNKPGEKDGWHSYTTSLRIRNWIWLFNFCPELVNKNRIKSLWHQICWLKSHPESCHGGNHWIENLTALAIGGSQFKGIFSKNILNFSLKQLKKELNFQILKDGGHQERSVSYHLLVLNRLVELGCVLELTYGSAPDWLCKYIEKMINWTESIKLLNRNFPSFNDSANDGFNDFYKILDFAKGFLKGSKMDINGYKGKLLELTLKKRKGTYHSNILDKKNNKLIDLPDTGWTILKPGDGWELTFKCGLSCPPHLAAHVHSDLLSFNLYHLGEEIITETGTSSYKKGMYRDYERSSAAHNSLQLGLNIKNKFHGQEPIDVWNVFRAGKKAKPLNKAYGYLDNWLWVQGSHDGFDSIGGKHVRFIAIKVDSHKKPIIVIIDKLFSRNQNLAFKSFFHLNPLYDEFEISKNLRFHYFNSKKNNIFFSRNIAGYLSRGFGIRENRKVIENYGSISKGTTILATVISDKSLDINCISIFANSGEIIFGGFDKLLWSIQDDFFSIFTKS